MMQLLRLFFFFFFKLVNWCETFIPAKHFLQEAHKMVKEANVKQAAAEKQLKEAQGKVSLFPACLFCLFT